MTTKALKAAQRVNAAKAELDEAHAYLVELQKACADAKRLRYAEARIRVASWELEAAERHAAALR